jgi:hypothetical protein
MAMVRVAAMLHARLLLPLLALAVVAYGSGLPPISKRSFPEGFIFGTASSSYQVRVRSCHLHHIHGIGSCLTLISSLPIQLIFLVLVKSIMM